MSNNDNQAYARHHYLQRAYLDKFADKRRLDVIDRQDGSVRLNQQTKDVANVRGFYTATSENGQKDGSLEGAFNQEIEAPGFKIINNMTSVFPYVPRGQERSILAYYMAFQYMRTPEAKRRFETDAGRLASIEMFNLANDPDKIKEHLVARGKDSSDESIAKYSRMILAGINGGEIIPDSNLWLGMIKQGMDTIAPFLVERYHWHLFYYDKPTFITSDHPVVARKIHNDHRGTGFANADEVMFPLSKNHGLLLTTDPTLPEGVHTKASEEAAEMLNYFVTSHSYLEIYSHPSLTSHFRGKALGKQPLTEMSGPDMPELAFLRRYTGVLERDRPRR